jgi:secreted effector protein SseD
MKVMIVIASALALAACGQTTGAARRAPAAGGPQLATVQKQAGTAKSNDAAQRCTDAMNKAAQAQTNAAMLGGALNMVGGLGGFGGRGGAIAAQAASVGGSVVQSQASAKAQADLQQCAY